MSTYITNRTTTNYINDYERIFSYAGKKISEDIDKSYLNYCPITGRITAKKEHKLPEIELISL